MLRTDARRGPRRLISILLALALALAPVLGALARTHEALHDVSGTSADGHFRAAAMDRDDCPDRGPCEGVHGDEGSGLHRLAHAFDCCAHVAAHLPFATSLRDVAPDGPPPRVDDATPRSLASQPLLEPPIR